MTEQSATIMAIDLFGGILQQVTASEWSTGTPNPGWDVRHLARHNVESLVWIPDMLAGKTIEEVGQAHDKQVESDDLQAVWTDEAPVAKAAVQDADLDRTVHMSYMDAPARTYLQHSLIDLVIHAWDLAQAIGAAYEPGAELVEAVYDWFVPQAEEWRSAGIIGPAVTVENGADATVKLLALAGRQA
jgi:uncharacterized protein (TIGR03086 family)